MRFEEIKVNEAREVNGGSVCATIIKFNPPKWNYTLPVVPVSPVKNETA